MQKLKNAGIIFMIGAVGYGLIEIIWRGYTHISMLFAGGICFNLFAVISKKCARMRRLTVCVLGSLAVTGIEFVFGCVFNLWLHKNVWDYSRMPLNIAGQVCPLYSFLWGLLSLLFIPLAGKTEKYLENGKM